MGTRTRDDADGGGGEDEVRSADLGRPGYCTVWWKGLLACGR